MVKIKSTVDAQRLEQSRRVRARSGGVSKGGGVASSAVSEADSVSVTDAARRLGEDLGRVEAQAADPARLAELREAIASGHFPIDIRRLAEKILAEDVLARGGK